MTAQGARVRRWSSAAALLALVAATVTSAAVRASASATLPPGCAHNAATITCTFGFTGSEQVFSVPSGVTIVQVTAIGAAGASSSLVPSGPAGQGAQITATLPVTGGTPLYVEVGGTPTLGHCYPNDQCIGGFNGGGSSYYGGGGGGASDVRTISTAVGSPDSSLDSRLVVAGGGGGAGANNFCRGGPGLLTGGSGGNAGWVMGQQGGGSVLCSGFTGVSEGGGGGEQDEGGPGGINAITQITPVRVGTPGALGAGGSDNYDGAGGGGGYYGGGSGADPLRSTNAPYALAATSTGGGGGSSFVPAGGTFALSSSPASVSISYPDPIRIATLRTAVTGPRAVLAGSRFSEVISVLNQGPDDAPWLTITVVVPNDLTVMSAPGTRLRRHAVWWIRPDVPSGQRVSYAMVLTAAPGFHGRVVLRATAGAAGTLDPDPAAASAARAIEIYR